MQHTSLLTPINKAFKIIVLLSIIASLFATFYQLVPFLWFKNTSSDSAINHIISYQDALLISTFIAITTLLALYNLMQYLSVKDKTYLIYTCYLLNALFLCLVIKGLSHVILPDTILSFLVKQKHLLHYTLAIGFITFSLYFLQDKSIQQRNNIPFYLIVLLFSIFSVDMLFSTQNNIYLWLQPSLYLVALFITIRNINKKLVWAKYYYLSCIPFLIGVVTQYLIQIDYLSISSVNQNTLLVGITLQVIFITFALAERMRKNEQDKLHHLTHHAQSGLPRQLNLVNTIQQMNLSLTSQQNFCVAILQPEHIDKIKHYVDDSYVFSLFKTFNNELNHHFKNNNAIIPLTANNEKLCYIHGKCLGFIVDTEKLNSSVETFVLSVQRIISDNYNIKDLHLSLTGVIGIAHYPNHGTSSKDLVKSAVLAIRQAELIPEKWAFYETHTPDKSAFLLELASDIQHALHNNEFHMYHQPQIDLKTGKVCGSECLIRWNHPTQGTISPTVFIPVAEDMGLINQITLWVIEKSLAQHAIIMETYKNHMVSINISGIDLISQNFYQHVVRIINNFTIPADKIIFEITESANIAKNERVVQVIEKLTDFGIRVSIDDFGTGYSSLANLDKLPFQELKVDKQFVENVHQDNKRTIIIETTIKMAKGLGLEVVAEGITTKKDETTLSDFGCDLGQGYYYSEALSLKEYLKWLAVQSNGKVPDDFYGEFIPASKAK